MLNEPLKKSYVPHKLKLDCLIWFEVKWSSSLCVIGALSVKFLGDEFDKAERVKAERSAKNRTIKYFYRR